MRIEREKAVIVAAYLTGNYSYRALSVKFGYRVGVIHKWVGQQRDKMSKPKQSKKKLSVRESPPAMTEGMPSDVKTLQEELRKARLHSQVLSAMIDIAEEDLGVTIRKKYGAGRS